MPSSNGSSQPRDQTWVSCTVGGFFTVWATREAQNTGVGSLSLPQGNFLTLESNWGLLHCKQILYQLSHQRSPKTQCNASAGNWTQASHVAGKNSSTEPPMQASKFLLAYFNKRIGRILHFRGPHEIRVFGLDVSITHFCHILLATASHKAWSGGKMWGHRCQLFMGSAVKWRCKPCGQKEGWRIGAIFATNRPHAVFQVFSRS